MRYKIVRQVGFDIATIVVLSVLAFELFQIFHGETQTMATLPQSLGVSSVVGIFLFAILRVRLMKRIGQPLREISDHMEDMSKGIFQKWEYLELSREVDRLTYAMNEVAATNNELQVSWRMISLAIARHFLTLRHREDLPEPLQNDLEEIWVTLNRIDEAIMGVFSPSPHFAKPRTLPTGEEKEEVTESIQSTVQPRCNQERVELTQTSGQVWREYDAKIPQSIPEVLV